MFIVQDMEVPKDLEPQIISLVMYRRIMETGIRTLSEASAQAAKVRVITSYNDLLERMKLPIDEQA